MYCEPWPHACECGMSSDMKVVTLLFVQLHNALQALEAHALISKVEYLVTPSWLKSSGGHKLTKCDARIFLSMNGCTQIHTPVHYCWDNIILSCYCSISILIHLCLMDISFLSNITITECISHLHVFLHMFGFTYL